MGDHIFAADLSLDQVDLKLGITLLDAGTLFGDLIVVSSKNVNDTIMAFREFYGEDPFYYFHSYSAKELKAAAEQEPMVHLTSTPHRPESKASWSGSTSPSSTELDVCYFRAGCQVDAGTTRAGPSSWHATPA